MHKRMLPTPPPPLPVAPRANKVLSIAPYIQESWAVGKGGAGGVRMKEVGWRAVQEGAWDGRREVLWRGLEPLIRPEELVKLSEMFRLVGPREGKVRGDEERRSVLEEERGEALRTSLASLPGAGVGEGLSLC